MYQSILIVALTIIYDVLQQIARTVALPEPRVAVLQTTNKGKCG